MNRSKPRALMAAVLLVLALSDPSRLARAQEGSADAPPTSRLRGAAAWAALLGNTISGTTPDGAYSEYFTEDGQVVYLDREGKDRGSWVLRDPLVCFSFPDDDEEDCRTPEIDGQRGAFIDRDGSRYTFVVQRGNAKHL